MPIQVIDASSWSEDYLREQIFAETDRPFNLEKSPVLRVKLFTRSAQEHILLMTMHHIAGDMWSFDLLLNELQVLYTTETEQVSTKQIEIAGDSLPKNKAYTEFVRWQSEMLSSAKGHSQTGAVATDDWLFRMIKGCIQLGLFPKSEMMIEMIPIDYASKAIVCISQAKSSLGKAFHITNHHQISWEYLTNWIQKFGYPVQQVSFEQWHEELIHHLNYFPENALHSLLPIFSQESDSQKIEFKFDNQNTLEALSGTEICCPPLNAELLDIYFSYFLKIGFLSAPEPTAVV